MQETIKPVIINGEDTGWRALDLGYLIRKDGVKTFGSKTSGGYMQISIANSTYQVHRVIAYAFLGMPPEVNPDGTELKGRALVNHKDEDKLNNKVENLEWCDHSYNERYGTKTQRASAKMNYIYKCLDTNEIGTSKFFADKYNLPQKHICAVANPNIPEKTVNGMTFEIVKGRG